MLLGVLTAYAVIKKENSKKETVAAENELKTYVSYLMYGDESHMDAIDHMTNSEISSAYIYKVLDSERFDGEGVEKDDYINDEQKLDYFINLTHYYDNFIRESEIDIDFSDEDERLPLVKKEWPHIT